MKPHDETKKGLEWDEVDKTLQKVRFDDAGENDMQEPKSCADIKTALEVCKYGCQKCYKCPYSKILDGEEEHDEICEDAIKSDALAYIQQFEAQNAELLKKVEQLQAERDAAVSELVGTCQVCRWEETEKCASCHFCEYAWNAHESNWEWRGVQKEE